MDIPSWAFKGNRVVCVDDAIDGDISGITIPQRGETYTIREVWWNDAWRHWQVRLAEIVNPPFLYADHADPLEAAFNVSRFRPLVSQQDDIEAHFSRFLETGRDARITEGV